MTKYLDLARKLKALADRGDGGEKYNAKKQLDLIMKKYGITMDMIEEETQFLITFKIPKQYQKLFIAIAISITGQKRYWGRRTRSFSILVGKVNKSEEAEIRAKFNFYSRVWNDQQEIFLLAFINKNEIFHSDSKTMKSSSMDEDQLKKAMKIWEASRLIEKSDYHRQFKSR